MHPRNSDALLSGHQNRPGSKRALKHRQGSASLEGLMVLIIFITISFSFFFLGQAAFGTYFRDGNHYLASPLL